MEMCKCLGQPGRVPSSQTISILGSFFFFYGYIFCYIRHPLKS